MPAVPTVPDVAHIPIWVDMTSAALGAISGALVATRRHFDLSGLLMLAVVTGLGGGLIRDTLLQRGTPVALTSPWLLPTAVTFGALVFLFSRSLAALHNRSRGLLLAVDVLFLGVYAIVGTSKGLEARLPSVSCVLLGVITGMGGGMLRDVLINEEPELMKPGGMVTFALLIGCSAQAFMVRVLGWSESVGAIAIMIVVVVRALAIWRGWSSPMPTDMVQQAQKIKIPKRRHRRDRPPPAPLP